MTTVQYFMHTQPTPPLLLRRTDDGVGLVDEVFRDGRWVDTLLIVKYMVGLNDWVEEVSVVPACPRCAWCGAVAAFVDDLGDPDKETAVCRHCHQLADDDHLEVPLDRAGADNSRVSAWVERRRSCYQLDLPEFYYYDGEGCANPASRDW